MLKLKENAVKTMARAIAQATGQKKILTESPKPIRLNQKLLQAFGVLAVPKNTPAPQPKNNAYKKPSALLPLIINEKNNDNQNNKSNLNIEKIESTKNLREELERENKEEQEQKIKDAMAQQEIVRAQKEKDRLREEKRRQLARMEAERAKKISEDIERKAKEKEERERKIQEEIERKSKEEQEQKIKDAMAQQEIVRAQKEKDRLREEKRRQLARMEAERAKKISEDIQRAKQKIVNDEKISEKNKLGQNRDTDDIFSILQKLKLKLHSKKETFEKKLATIPSTKAPLEQKIFVLKSKVAMIENSELAAVVAREQEIEKGIEIEKEKLTQNNDQQQEKVIKQKIWAAEDQRKEIEQQRWEVEDKINKILAEAKNVSAEIADKENEIEIIKQDIKKTINEEKLVKFTTDKNKLEEEILKIIDEKNTLSPVLASALDKKNEVKTSLNQISQKESSENNDLNAIEIQEKQAEDSTKKREVEQSRQRASDKLKLIVQSKWETEEKLTMTTRQAEELQEKMDNLNLKIDKIQNNITDEEMTLEKEGLPVRKIRDSIEALLKENNIEIDQEVLKDIVQIQNSEKQESVPSEKPATIDQNKSTGETTINNTAQIILEPSKIQVISEKSPTIGKKTNQPEIPQLKKATDTSVPQNPTHHPPQPIISTVAKPTMDSGAQINNKITSETAADAKKIEKIPLIIQKSDTKITPAPANEIASFYREQVDASPAKNIRSFPRDNSPEKSPQQIITDNKNREIPKNIATEPDELLKETNPQNLENRWKEIKKTTLPTINPPTKNDETINQATPISAPEQLIASPGKNKLLARMIVVFVIAGVLGILLVIILSKNDNPAPVPIATNQDQPNKNPPEIKIPTLKTIGTKPIYTEDLTSVPNLISPYLQKSLGESGYYEIVIQNKKTETKVGLRQFLNVYKINAPSLFYGSVSDDFILFVYSLGNGKNRLGFVVEVTNAETLRTAMARWEGSIKTDTENLFKLLGRKIQDAGTEPKFITSGAGETKYQLMNFTPATDNLSIAWANYKQKYFIFATSNESMAKIFNQLPK